MACYTEWDTYLKVGSDEYEERKKELSAKLDALKHIVDYYYKVSGLRVPPAQHSGKKSWIEMAHLEFSIEQEALSGKDEEAIWQSVGRHCACDGIGFTLLYDAVSLLDLTNENDAGYARVLMACANNMRGNRYKYEVLEEPRVSERIKREKTARPRLP